MFSTVIKPIFCYYRYISIKKPIRGCVDGTTFVHCHRMNKKQVEGEKNQPQCDQASGSNSSSKSGKAENINFLEVYKI